MTKARYRIFISSPGDMGPERQLVSDAIARVNASLQGVSLEAYLSEQDLYFAHRGPQEGIPLTSDYDLVVCLLWKRIGTLLLPDRFNAPDGRKRTGTEFEFETAVEAARSHRTEGGLPRPAVLVYRKTEAVLFNADRVDEQQLQYRALNAFFERWIRDVNGHYLGYANTFETAQQFSDMIERHLRDWLALQRRGIDWDIAQKGSPFRGLEVFDDAHADVFFGRDDCILSARARLKRAAANGFGALWIVGASGSGKSSLLRAGLLPSLRRSEGETLLRAVVFKPSELGTAAMTGFAGKLIATLHELDAGSFRDADSLARVCIESPASARIALANALDAWSATEAQRRDLDRAPATRLVIAIDQAEELLTTRSEVERDQLVRLLLQLLGDERVWLVLSFRSDFYAALQHDARLLPLKERAAQLDLGAPTEAELESIITEPARVAGLTIEETDDCSLTTELVTDTGSADSLPMLEFALKTLFEKACLRGDRLLRIADYLSIGRAAGALSSAADAAFTLTSANAQDAFARVLRQLVDMNLQSKDSPSTARTFPLSRFNDDPPALELIDALSRPEARLLSLFDVDGKPHCRVVHESLFTRWPRAKEQIERDARRLDARRRLEEDQTLWQDAAPNDKRQRLLHGLLLQEALDLKGHWKLEPTLTNFIEKSLAVERRRQHVRTFLSVTFAVAALVAAGMALYARNQQFRAEQSESASQQMLQQAALRAFGQMQDALLSGNLAVAHAHLAESLRYADTPQARLAAAYQLQRLPFAPYRTLSATKVQRAAYSADGRKIVTMSFVAAEVWDAATGHRVSPALPNPGPFTKAQLVPNDDVAVTVGHGRISVWNTQTGTEIGNGIRTTERVLVRQQVSKDGRVALRWFNDTGNLEVVNLRSDRPARTIPRASRKGFLPALSEDGNVFAISPQPDLLHVISAETMQPVSPQPTLPYKAKIFCVAFTPNGNLLVYLGAGQIALWQRAQNTLALMDTAASTCDRISVSPDDSTLAAIGDKTIEIWRVNDSYRLENLVSPGLPVSAEFSADGLRLVVASEDNIARQWLLNPLQEIGAPMRHRAELRSVAYSPDGLTVLTVAADGLVRLWDARSSAVAELPLRHDAEVSHAEFSADGRFVLTSTQNTAQVFSAEDGKPAGEPITFPDTLELAKLSGDTRFIMTAQDDGSVRLWNFATRAPIDSNALTQLTGAALSSDGRTLAIGDESGVVKILTIPDFRPIARSRPLEAAPSLLSFSPDNDKLLVVDAAGVMTTWDLSTGIQRTAETSLRSELQHAEFSSDGERIVAVYDDFALILNSSDVSERATAPVFLQSGHFSPSGDTLVFMHRDGTISLVDGRTGNVRATRSLRGSPETDAIYDPDGTRIAVGTSEGLFLLDSETLNLLGPPLPNGSGITDGLTRIAFSPDGRRLLGVVENGTVVIWEIRAQLDAEPWLLSRALTLLGGLEVSDSGRLEAIADTDAMTVFRSRIPAPPSDNGRLEAIADADDPTARLMANRTAGELARILEWHNSDRERRSVSPFSTVPQAKHIRDDIDWAAASASEGTTPAIERALTESYVASPGHPLALLGMAIGNLADHHYELAIRLSVARLKTSLDVDTICRGAELLQQLDEPAAALTVADHALSLEAGNERATRMKTWAAEALTRREQPATAPTAATSAPTARPSATDR